MKFSSWVWLAWNLREQTSSIRPQLLAELSVQLISRLRNTFRFCFKILQTLLYKGYTDEDNATIRDDAVVLQILIVGPRLPSKDICYWLLILHQCNNYRPNLFKIVIPGQQYWNQQVWFPFTNYNQLVFIQHYWERAMNNHYCVVQYILWLMIKILILTLAMLSGVHMSTISFWSG